jgi:hypothetical protein
MFFKPLDGVFFLKKIYMEVVLEKQIILFFKFIIFNI